MVALILIPILFLSLSLPFSASSLDAAVDPATADANAVRRAGVDTALQRYSFLALSDPSTNSGVAYDVPLTPHFNGITAQAIHLASVDSLATHGLLFNEISIPASATIQGSSSSSSAILVYRKISNFTVYSLPSGYGFVSPIVGIVAYLLPGPDSGTDMPPEANLVSSIDPITFAMPISGKGSSPPLCAYMGVDGSVTLGNVSVEPNICHSSSMTDVSLVAAIAPTVSPTPTTPAAPLSSSPPESPVSPTTPTQPSPSSSSSSSPSTKTSSQAWKTGVGVTFGVLAALALIVLALRMGIIEKARVAIIERYGNHEETLLHTNLFGNSRAPMAAPMRTQPILENSYLPS